MMGWLTDWLKQVILIILLAAFVDLLLPNQTMQRYVKTVVSLFILMVLLTPVFELFHKGWNTDKLMAEAERIQSGAGLVKDGGFKSLDAIMAESRKLKSDNEQEARKLAESRLSEEMKAGLERATGIQADELAVQINVDDQGNPAIGQVRAVLLHKQAPETQVKTDASVRSIGQVRVEPVKPVSIAVGAAPEDAVSAAAVTAGSDQLRTDAESYFRKEWQLPPERLILKVGS